MSVACVAAGASIVVAWWISRAAAWIEGRCRSAAADTAEFHRQACALAECWREGGVACSFQEWEGRNHYDLILDLAEPSSALVKRCLDQMGLPYGAPIA